MTWLRLLLASSVLSSCAGQSEPQQGDAGTRLTLDPANPHGEGPKQRLIVLKWYCNSGTHADAVPCQNYAFLQQVRESSNTPF